jgi:lipopolysaccharide transport system ATP-binding protein
MANNVAVRIENVYKRFIVGRAKGGDGLRHLLQDYMLHPFRLVGWNKRPNGGNGSFSRNAQREEFWALQEVSIDVSQGEVIGVIGRNGAGKSTLLKILSRITEPTKGRIGLKGRVASLLEVGTGFHPELTGRENIFLNGAILGMSRREIKSRFEEIVEFAGVNRFIDTPVKRYSSGMYVRLAFAVAAHLEPEILIVDEVLAVGDAEFQKKCLGKMREVAARGHRTVFFVSHQLPSVIALCSRACLLENGRLVADGDPTGVVERYQKQTLGKAGGLQNASARPGSGTVRIQMIRATADVFAPAEAKRFTLLIDTIDESEAPYSLALHLLDESGQQILILNSRHAGQALLPGSKLRVELTLRTPWLTPGEYRVDAFLYNNGIIDKWEDACRFAVSNELPYAGTPDEPTVRGSVVLPDFSLTIDR